MDTRKVIETQMIGFVHRADLHPLEEAHAFSVALEKGGYSSKEIAAKIGKSASYVEQRIVLLNLIGPMQQYFLSGHMNAYQAMQIARCTPAFQEEIQKRFGAFLEGSYTLETRDLVDFIDANSHRSMKKRRSMWTTRAGSGMRCVHALPEGTTNRPDLFEGVPRMIPAPTGSVLRRRCRRTKTGEGETAGEGRNGRHDLDELPESPEGHPHAAGLSGRHEKREGGRSGHWWCRAMKSGRRNTLSRNPQSSRRKKREKAQGIRCREDLRDRFNVEKNLKLRIELLKAAQQTGLHRGDQAPYRRSIGDWSSQPTLEEYGLDRKTITGDQHLLVMIIESDIDGGWGEMEQKF